MKIKLILILCFSCFLINPMFAQEQLESNKEESIKDKIPSFILPKSFLKEQPNINTGCNYSEFIKLYEKEYSVIFSSILTSLTDADFNIHEIDSGKGYIVFSLTNGKKFVIAITNIDSKKNYVKIMPYDSKYDFPSEIIQLLFEKVDLALADKVKDTKVKN